MKELKQWKEKDLTVQWVSGRDAMQPSAHITTGFIFQLWVYSDFMCIYSIFEDLF